VFLVLCCAGAIRSVDNGVNGADRGAGGLTRVSFDPCPTYDLTQVPILWRQKRTRVERYPRFDFEP